MDINKIITISLILVLLVVFSQAQSQQGDQDAYRHIRVDISPEKGYDAQEYNYDIRLDKNYFIDEENPIDQLFLEWHDDQNSTIASAMKTFDGHNPVYIPISIDQSKIDLFIGKIYAEFYTTNRFESIPVVSPEINFTISYITDERTRNFSFEFKSIERGTINIYGISKEFRFNWNKFNKEDKKNLTNYLQNTSLEEPIGLNIRQIEFHKEKNGNVIKVESGTQKYILERYVEEQKAVLKTENGKILDELRIDDNDAEYVYKEIRDVLTYYYYDPSKFGWLNKTIDTKGYEIIIAFVAEKN